MFEQWGFLLTEIWVLLVLAALIGLIAGWLIFGGKQSAVPGSGKANKLRSEIDQYRVAAAQQQARITSLEEELAASKKTSASVTAISEGTAAVDESTDIPETPDVPDLPEIPKVVDPLTIGTEPETLDEPINGKADDLKKIKGVGPKLERLCNMMGFWNYEQIAKWSDDEVAWVDENLQGFKGRVSRDEWVDQATVSYTHLTLPTIYSV